MYIPFSRSYLFVTRKCREQKKNTYKKRKKASINGKKEAAATVQFIEGKFKVGRSSFGSHTIPPSMYTNDFQSVTSSNMQQYVKRRKEKKLKRSCGSSRTLNQLDSIVNFFFSFLKTLKRKDDRISAKRKRKEIVNADGIQGNTLNGCQSVSTDRRLPVTSCVTLYFFWHLTKKSLPKKNQRKRKRETLSIDCQQFIQQGELEESRDPRHSKERIFLNRWLRRHKEVKD